MNSSSKFLKNLKLTSAPRNDNLELKVPSYRVDVNRHADVVEEILRIYGFNKIEIPNKLNTSIHLLQNLTLKMLKKTFQTCWFQRVTLRS